MIGNIPNPSVPFFDNNGNVSQAWWRFFNALADNADSAAGRINAAVINTWYDVGNVASQGGVLAVVDATSGGTALFTCDVTGGVHTVYNGVANLEVTYNSSVLQARVTGGSVPRSLKWAMVLANSQ